MPIGTYNWVVEKVKAELLQEVIFFLINLFGRDVLVIKKLETAKTKYTQF